MALRGFRKSRYRRLRMWLVVLTALVAAMTGLFFRCRPVLTAFAESRAKLLATTTANAVVAEVLEENADLCRQAVQVDYDDQQKVASVFTDTASVNVLRTAATRQIIAEMGAVDTIAVGVPIGTLFGPRWLSGWGPAVTFPMSVSCTVVSSVTSRLEAAGMNQTHYRVMLNMTIQTYVVTPGGRSSVAVEVTYPMTEAVLLGEVPDNLTEVYGDDQTVLGKIFDYGTSGAE